MEEYKFNFDELVIKCKSAIERVMEFRAIDDSDDENSLPIEELFHTAAGKRLESQVEQVLEFATKGQILTIISSMAPFVEGMFQAMAEGSFSKVISQSEKKPPPQDVQLISDMESLTGRLDGMNMTEGFESLPSADDRPWYSSLLILSLYAYVDIYSRSIIDIINDNSELKTILDKYLQTLVENRTDSIRPPITDSSDMKRFGIKRRLTTIEDGLDIRAVLIEIVGDKKMKKYRKGFQKFLDIRNKIAHSNPKLNHVEYTIKEFEDDVEDIAIEFEELDTFVGKIGFAQYGLPQLKEAAIDIAVIFKKIRLVLLMSIIYPALIDCVLHIMDQ